MTTKARTWTDVEIAKLSDAEYEKHSEEIDAAVVAGRVKKAAAQPRKGRR